MWLLHTLCAHTWWCVCASAKWALMGGGISRELMYMYVNEENRSKKSTLFCLMRPDGYVILWAPLVFT